VLPAKIPHLLVNGCTGIAVGMATNIPPHNLGEVCEARGRADRRPEAGDQGPAEVHQGSDFPTGGQIINSKKELRDIYETGQGGRAGCAAKWKTESGGRGGGDHVVDHVDPVRVAEVDGRSSASPR
jgi:DNA gyrase subunit A